MTIFQYKNGYRYNSDSLILCDFILKNAKIKDNFKVLDIGCGCGVLGLFLSAYFKISVDGLDLNSANTFLTMFNNKINKILGGDFYFGDIGEDILKQLKFGDFCYEKAQEKSENIQNFNCFKNLLKQEVFTKDLFAKYDLIISNPPFYSANNESKNIHQNMSKHIKFLPTKIFINRAFKLLKPRGEFIFCYESTSFLEVLSELALNKFSVECIQFFSTKKDKNPNLMCIKARKCIKKTPTFLHPQTYEMVLRDFYPKFNLISKDFEIKFDDVLKILGEKI